MALAVRATMPKPKELKERRAHELPFSGLRLSLSGSLGCSLEHLDLAWGRAGRRSFLGSPARKGSLANLALWSLHGVRGCTRSRVRLLGCLVLRAVGFQEGFVEPALEGPVIVKELGHGKVHALLCRVHQSCVFDAPVVPDLPGRIHEQGSRQGYLIPATTHLREAMGCGVTEAIRNWWQKLVDAGELPLNAALFVDLKRGESGATLTVASFHDLLPLCFVMGPNLVVQLHFTRVAKQVLVSLAVFL